jgi:hypothetical protein
MSRSIRDNEMPFGGREITIGHIDRDPLLAFGLQAVDEEGEVEGEAARPEAPGVGTGGLELVLVEAVRVVQEPPDEGALPVVDAPRREEAQEAPLAVGFQEVVQPGAGQK